jgi:starch synthase
LLQAWEKAELRSAELHLVGSWYLSDGIRVSLPRGVTYVSACSSEALREHYRRADVFVFPSFFEGFGLVLLEAMACGLPAIASTATAGPDVLTEDSGRVLPVGNLDSLVETLQWFGQNRDRLPKMARAAREQAELCSWERYRSAVRRVTERFA